MSYTTDDFTESISRAGISPEEIASVESAWGRGTGQGDDAGHYRWAPDGATDWSGGFLLRLNDDSYVYLTGWCDYTGWGCQDGAQVYRFASRPSREEIDTAVGEIDEWAPPPPDAAEWDIEPADLNRWLEARR